MADEDDVIAVAHERAEALSGRDEAGLRRLLHADFRWISHRGDRFDLETYVAANCRGSQRWSGQELRDPTVCVVGGTAVLQCTAVDSVDGGDGDETFVMPMTQTWVRTARGWECLAGHAGPRLNAAGSAGRDPVPPVGLEPTL